MTFPRTPEQHPTRFRRNKGVIEQAFWLSPGEIRAARAAIEASLLRRDFNHSPYTRECLESSIDKLTAE